MFIFGCCVASRRSLDPFNITINPLPPPEPFVPKQLMQATKQVGSSSAALVGLAAPSAAVQASRINLVLRLESCEPDDEDLDWTQSPTGVQLGSDSFAMLAGGAVMNPVIVCVIAASMVLAALLRSWRVGEPLAAGLEWVRFPSLVAFPVMFLLEPTVMCGTTLLYHEAAGMRAVGALSLALCVAVPAVVWAYFRPAHFGATFVNTADGDDAPTSWWKRLLSALDAKYEWRDSEASAGYCRRNRLLFSDYTQRFHRFIVIEMGMCIVTGALEGMQGRSGQCIGVMVALVVVLVSFCTVQVVLRPYNESAVSVFSVATSFFQSVAASAMLLHIAFHTQNALDVVEVATMCLSYLMLLNLVFALYPRLHAALIWAWDQMTSMSERGVKEQETSKALLEVAEVKDPTGSAESRSTPPPPLTDDGASVNEFLNELPDCGSALVNGEWSLFLPDQEAPKGAPLLFFESDGRGRDFVGNRWEPLLREGAFPL